MKIPDNPISKAYVIFHNVTYILDCPIDLKEFDLINDQEKITHLNTIKRKIIELYVYLAGDVPIVKFDYEN